MSGNVSVDHLHWRPARLPVENIVSRSPGNPELVSLVSCSRDWGVSASWSRDSQEQRTPGPGHRETGERSWCSWRWAGGDNLVNNDEILFLFNARSNERFDEKLNFPISPSLCLRSLIYSWWRYLEETTVLCPGSTHNKTLSCCAPDTAAPHNSDWSSVRTSSSAPGPELRSPGCFVLIVSTCQSSTHEYQLELLSKRSRFGVRRGS